jgi:hypothetical protein
MVPIKKGVANSVTYLEKPEIDALLAAPDRSSSQGARDHALLLFLYNSGARASEAASLRIGDIDWHARSVRILGKGSKERRCPLWATTIEELRRLAGQRPNDAPMFLNRRGVPITRYGIHTMVERYVARLRATAPQLRGKRISPHPPFDRNALVASRGRHQHDPRLARPRIARHHQHLCRDRSRNQEAGFGDARSRQNAQGVRGLVPKAECHGVLALVVASQICGAGLHNPTEYRSGTGSAPHIGLRHIPLHMWCTTYVAEANQ